MVEPVGITEATVVSTAGVHGERGAVLNDAILQTLAASPESQDPITFRCTVVDLKPR